jgi:hypothetical protein
MSSHIVCGPGLISGNSVLWCFWEDSNEAEFCSFLNLIEEERVGRIA